MLLRILYIALLTYFIYKLVFDFIIPVFTTTRKVRKAFYEARQRQDPQYQNRSGNQSNSQEPIKPQGDYIDFEEVK
jgi:hypothetical protein